MKITCPDCDTSYDIKAELVGAEGRSVKCARCGNRWFISPRKESLAEAGPLVDEPDAEEDVSASEDWAEIDAETDGPDDRVTEEEKEAFAAPPRPAPAPARVEPAATADQDDASRKTVDIESLANRRKIQVNPNKMRRQRDWSTLTRHLTRQNLRRVGGALILFLALGTGGTVFLVRDAVVKEAPDLASLFKFLGFQVNLRGLEFRDLRTFREVENGAIVLVVEGTIQNIGKEPVPVPAVRLSLRSEEQQEIYAWTLEPRALSLAGEENTRFRTRLADPPDSAADIQVRFIDRHKQQANLQGQ
ncbi:zinc-ribbon domain-containing protein [Polymorphum gilvum]|uniref:Zinc finger/thioredoxin putative n=1 Tax=Polymorphum gilvum (strain LMG 25793 / CGMCC 1.9160 / SL003B-26A1) TaxID=991905 RepID=F2IZE5_POLGS|nr:zinc-ribbon domain-containing protein [Polymorphum gilvum]ADZ68568.1 Zinc finger/thioredoxin putative [Polymorphum gilvum SL003B-26A1]